MNFQRVKGTEWGPKLFLPSTKSGYGSLMLFRTDLGSVILNSVSVYMYVDNQSNCS